MENCSLNSVLALVNKPLDGAEMILNCNESTSNSDLLLNPHQAAALWETYTESLEKSGRIEFGEFVVKKLIETFNKSPFVNQYNYEETLHRLIEFFYSFRNEISDNISDDELIACMSKAFNGECGGSFSLLSDTVQDMIKSGKLGRSDE